MHSLATLSLTDCLGNVVVWQTSMPLTVSSRAAKLIENLQLPRGHSIIQLPTIHATADSPSTNKPACFGSVQSLESAKTWYSPELEKRVLRLIDA